MSIPEIIVYSKPSCCLCEKVKDQLSKLREKHDFVWREVNILEDAASYEKFKNEIPVIFVNGEIAFKHHLDEKDFIRLLKPATGDTHKNRASSDSSGA